MDDEIKELVRDLRARAATCKALAVKDINPSTTRRLLGKAAAYTHSAELAQAMGDRLGVSCL
jgi:hypothetical protein